MSRESGVVEKIAKGAKAYSALVNGTWYGAGFSLPTNFKEGDNIDFEYTVNGKFKNMTVPSVKVAAPAETESPKGKSGTGSATGTRGKTTTRDTYWEDKAETDKKTQREIRLQASRNAAIAFVDVLLKNDALPTGTVKKNKAGVIEEAVAHYASQFYDETERLGQEGEFAVRESIDTTEEESDDNYE